jgi:hypothetical protein
MKKILLALTLFALVTGVSAQSLQNFEYSPGDDYSVGLTGGESFTQEINFTSEEDRPLPLGVEVWVEANNTEFETGELMGAEFDVSGTMKAENVDMLQFVESMWENDQIGIYNVKELEGEEAVALDVDYIVAPQTEESLDSEVTPDETDFGDLDLTTSIEGEENPPYLRNVRPEEGVDQGVLFRLPSPENNSSDLRPVLIPVEASIEETLNFSSENVLANESVLVYRRSPGGVLDSGIVLPDSENSLSVSVRSDPAIRPDSFDFSFDVESIPGAISKSDSVESVSGNLASLEAGNASASISTENNASVELDYHDVLYTVQPEGQFLSGLIVEALKDGREVDASGNITLRYDQDTIDGNDLSEGSIQVYYYNESSISWSTEGVEILDRDTDDDFVRAEVDHFSTYAAFAEEEEDEEPDEPDDEEEPDSTLTSSTVDDEDENQTDDQEDSEEPTDSENTTEDDSTGDDQIQDNQTQDDTPGDDTDGDTGPEQSITGQFTQSPGITGLGLLFLLGLVVAGLEYSGRTNIRERIRSLRSREEESEGYNFE